MHAVCHNADVDQLLRAQPVAEGEGKDRIGKPDQKAPGIVADDKECTVKAVVEEQREKEKGEPHQRSQPKKPPVGKMNEKQHLRPKQPELIGLYALDPPGQQAQNRVPIHNYQPPASKKTVRALRKPFFRARLIFSWLRPTQRVSPSILFT